MPISSDKFILNFAPTGIVTTKDANPFVPTTPDEILKDVGAAYALGASIVHLHARDSDGKPSRNPLIYQRLIGDIRQKFPELIICVSLSARIEDGFDQLAPLNSSEKPDMASLTVGSVSLPSGISANSQSNIMKICDTLIQRGIKPEIEAFEPGMLEFCHYLIRKNKMGPPLYCNIFVGARGAAPLNAANIAAFIANAPRGTVLCAAGIGRYQMKAAGVGLTMLDGVRVGIEDCPYSDYQKKTPIKNSDILSRTVKMAEIMGRSPITPTDLRKILFS